MGVTKSEGNEDQGTDLYSKVHSTRNVIDKRLKSGKKRRSKGRGRVHEVLDASNEFPMGRGGESAAAFKGEARWRAHFEASFTDLTSSRMCWIGAEMASSRLVEPRSTKISVEPNNKE